MWSGTPFDHSRTGGWQNYVPAFQYPVSFFVCSLFGVPSEVILHTYIFAEDRISPMSAIAWAPYRPPNVSNFPSLKESGLQILYEIADSASGLRAGGERNFLAELDTLELAILGTVVKSLGLGYGSTLNPLSSHKNRERSCIFEDK